jgi:YihY family inner membrane protein
MAHDTNTSHLIQNIKNSAFVQTTDKGTKPLQAFVRKFSNDWATTFAGSLAYSLLTAMLPIAIAIVAILGFILGIVLKSPQQSTDYLTKISQSIPALNNQDLVQSVGNRLSTSAGPLVIISVILAVFGGSRLFIAIENCMNIIYRHRPRRPIKQNLIAILMMLVFVLLIPIMVFASTLPAILYSLMNSVPALKQIPILSTFMDNAITIQLVGYAGGLLAAFILFEAIYLVVPNQHITLRNSYLGAIVSAVLLEVFIALFPLYTSHFMHSYVGQIGFAVVLLAFFYYFAIILILGGEVNAFFFEHVQPLPDNIASVITSIADDNGQAPAVATTRESGNAVSASKDNATTAHFHFLRRKHA